MTECKTDEYYWSFENRHARLLARCTPEEIDAMNDNSANPRFLRRCRMCDILFGTVSKYLKHLGTEEHDKVRCKKLGIEFVPKKKPHCVACDRDFLNEKNLERHYKTALHLRVLAPKPVKIFECKCCNKQFIGKNPKSVLRFHKLSKRHKMNKELQKLRKSLKIV